MIADEVDYGLRSGYVTKFLTWILLKGFMPKYIKLLRGGETCWQFSCWKTLRERLEMNCPTCWCWCWCDLCWLYINCWSWCGWWRCCCWLLDCDGCISSCCPCLIPVACIPVRLGSMECMGCCITACLDFCCCARLRAANCLASCCSMGRDDNFCWLVASWATGEAGPGGPGGPGGPVGPAGPAGPRSPGGPSIR